MPKGKNVAAYVNRILEDLHEDLNLPDGLVSHSNRRGAATHASEHPKVELH
jgi:hypothetical protein